MSFEAANSTLDSMAAEAMQTAIAAMTRAQQQLIHSERRHRAIIQNAVDAIITIDEFGIIESANSGAERLFGYKIDELVGKNVSMLVPLPDRNQHDGYIRNYLQTREARIIGIGRDVTGLRKDGSSIPIYLSIGHFELDGKNFFTGIMHDLTDRRAYEESLRRITAVFESSNDAIIVMSPDGIVTNWNDAAAELFGYSADEIIGRSASVIVPADQRALQEANLRRVRSGDRVVQIETRCVRKNGDSLDISLNASPICDATGNVIGVSASARDITAQKRAERELRERAAHIETINAELAVQRDETEAKRQELENVNHRLNEAMTQAKAAAKAKTDFLANMSHEIRTPLTAILGYIDLLGGAERLDGDEPRQMFETIRRNSRQLLCIVDDILDITRIESGKMQLDRRPISPTEVVLDVIDLLRSPAYQKGLTLTFDAHSDIPEVIHCDSMRLRQILTNLVGNAIKFTEAGSVRVAAELARDGADSELVFRVIDTGIGFHGDPARLFEPFVQGDAGTTRQYGGTGLGLSISLQLARMLGGSITASSAATKGSIFTLTVPTGPLDSIRLLSAEQCIGRRSALADEANRKLPPCRILLVEDGLDNQRLIERILTNYGATVEVACNGAVAYERLTVNPGQSPAPALVLMDMQMPVMDGYEATSKLRAWGYGGTIIALTAHAMAEDRAKCLDAGCDGYAAKPINRPAFIELLRQHLAGVTSGAGPSVTTESNVAVLLN